MYGNGRVVAVVPAFQEEARIGDTVRSLVASGKVDEVVAVDDGSTDGTSREARGAGASVIRLERNLGKGAALTVAARTLLGRARPPEVVLLADADLGSTATALGALIDAVRSGACDVAVAHPPRQEGAAGFGIVVKSARWGLRALTGHRYGSPLSGQRAISGPSLPWLIPFGSGFGVEVAMTIEAHQRGLRVVEVPVPIRHAPTGRNLPGLRHRGRQARDVLLVLVRAARRRVGRRRGASRRPRPAAR